jgi:hypothetical protein
VDYLSDAWLDALTSAASATSVGEVTNGGPLVVQTVITDGPRGEVTYHLVLDGPALAVRRGRAERPTVTFTQDFETAADVASGRTSAQAAFMGGDIRVGGDVTALIEHRAALAAFDEVMASVASRTHFPESGR